MNDMRSEFEAWWKSTLIANNPIFKTVAEQAWQASRAAMRVSVLPAGWVAVPVEPTPEIVSSIAQFLAKKGYLSHPNVPYHGTEEGDSPDAWHVRLLVALWKAAITARPGALGEGE